MSADEPLDEKLLANILSAVRCVEVKPMHVRISRVINGKQTAMHLFEIKLTDEVEVIQKGVMKIASKWKGGFEVGVQYIVERMG